MKKEITFTVAMIMILGAAALAEVSVTVYNSNLGVVRDTRQLEFEKGTGTLSFTDVPSQIDPTSVGFKLNESGKSAAILEQNYAYDLVTPEKIYQKYIDKEIDLFDENGNIFSGTLLSYNGGMITLRDKNDKIQIIRMEQVVNANFPDLPDGLITRPTLFWLYSADFSGNARCDVSYQTTGLSWNAEYVGVLSENEKDLQISGWASINNQSGATFADATLKLVAGDINRARSGAPAPDMRLMKAAALDEAEGFQEKKFFEYHLYTLPRKTTLADHEIKQLSLFDPTETGVEKEYRYMPDRNAKNIEVLLKFVNSDENGMGMPLPAGRTRIFKADTDGSMVLLGEDRIDHTPKDEEVKLTIGNAFDIVGEYKTMNVTRISSRVTETEYEIELRNRKDIDIVVTTLKTVYGDWEITNSNYEFERKDANTIRFNLPVRANGTTTLNFTVRTQS